MLFWREISSLIFTNKLHSVTDSEYVCAYVILDTHFFFFFLYIHGSVHRVSVLIRYNKMQQYAGIYLLQVYSTSFGRPSRPLSVLQKL